VTDLKARVSDLQAVLERSRHRGVLLSWLTKHGEESGHEELAEAMRYMMDRDDGMTSTLLAVGRAVESLEKKILAAGGG